MEVCSAAAEAIFANPPREGQLIRTIIVAAFAVLAATPAVSQSSPTSTLLGRFTTTNSGQPIVPPPGPVQVTVQTVSFKAGEVLPPHWHPHTRYGYVLSGKIRVDNIDTGKTETFVTGQPIIEAIKQWHTGSALEPTVLLVIDQVPPGQGNVELAPPTQADPALRK